MGGFRGFRGSRVQGSGFIGFRVQGSGLVGPGFMGSALTGGFRGFGVAGGALFGVEVSSILQF